MMFYIADTSLAEHSMPAGGLQCSKVAWDIARSFGKVHLHGIAVDLVRKLL